ncbi:MAG: hypothetical protein OSA85_04195 [Psychrobacter pacificensis]|nr:hypothetical protein [Psychrobacter pacificensis]MDE0843249.1 hypothetical protein [Psychrobacter pacificensis]
MFDIISNQNPSASMTPVQMTIKAILPIIFNEARHLGQAASSDE